MVILSLRCSHKEIDYLVITGTQTSHNISVKNNVKMPANKEWPEILEWSYNEFAELIGEHSPDIIIFKKTEPFFRGRGRAALHQRAVIESILQLIAQQKQIQIKGKVKTTIAKDLKFKGSKKYVIRDTNVQVLNNVGLTENQKEAFIAGLSELPTG